MQPLRTSTASSAQEALLFDRFEVLEELGVGGFGAVVRALDRVTGHEVALKVLHRVDQEATERFKKEFRALVELEHPNLVRLGELFERRGAWAFSMELVPGDDLLGWVRGPHGVDAGRLRAALVQLVSALEALHRADLIHRDIKPANVRVTPSGRVVLLDFGLVTHLAQNAQSTAEHVMGTLAYMAPEQTESAPLTHAVDMYALGVLLYEALTGRLPFSGDLRQVLMAKYGQTPVPPSTWAADTPPDLDALAGMLLATDPTARPGTSEVLARLGGAPSLPVLVAQPVTDEVFVGRAHELASLHAHFERARAQGPAMVLVEGESGIGKTALIARFLDALRGDGARPQILRGRCHPFEHVGYKAFDGIVDQLVRVLRARPDDAPMPASSGLLAQLFPALSRVRAVAARRMGAQVERTALFDAFRDLLALLSAAHPMVLAIDDLHWADSESVALVKDLLDCAKLPGLLLVASVRPDAQADLGVLDPLLSHARVSRLLLSALSSNDARALLGELLPAEEGAARREQLLAEAGGHPLFLAELAHGDAGRDREHGLTLDEALRARVERLATDVRRVLAFVCVAGAPLPHGVLADALELFSRPLAASRSVFCSGSAPSCSPGLGQAARADTDPERSPRRDFQPTEGQGALGISLGALYRALAILRIGRLVRSVHGVDAVAYHDRVSEAVVSRLGAAERAGLHVALAEAWQRAETGSAARVAQHYLAAGEALRAAPWLERAADEALATAAFERAAELLETRLSLAVAPLDEAARKRMRLLLADTLARAGRCSASARTLLEVLAGCTGDERRELLLRAAQQLLQAGEVREGLAAARTAVEEVGLAWSRGPVAALARLAWYGGVLGSNLADAPAPSARGTPWRTPSARAERQLDTLSRLLHPLFWADLLRCSEMGARYARLASEQGAPRHVARALAMQSVLSTLRDPGAYRIDLSDRAAEWAALDGAPETLAYQAFSRGGCLVFTAHFGEARTHFERAERLYRTECKGEAWMHGNARGALLGCLFLSGEHAQFRRRAAAWVRDAEARGDAFARAQLALVGRAAFLHLFDDRPDDALTELARAVEPWRVNSFGLHHFFETDMRHHVLSYASARRAFAWWRAERPEQRLLYRQLKGFVNDTVEVYRAEATLAYALETGEARWLVQARTDAARLARARTPRVQARALLIEAQLQAREGRRDDARALAAEVAARFRSLGEQRAEAGVLLAAALGTPAARCAAEEALLATLRMAGWTNPGRALTWMLPVYPHI